MTTAALACLALTVYFEARNQPIAGQVAVAQIVMNRVESARYPDDVCAVVWQSRQFSWTHDGLSDVPYNISAWEQAKLVANAVVAGSRHAGLDDVLHYHANYVRPFWAQRMTTVVQIADHIFLRENDHDQFRRLNRS